MNNIYTCWSSIPNVYYELEVVWVVTFSRMYLIETIYVHIQRGIKSHIHWDLSRQVSIHSAGPWDKFLSSNECATTVNEINSSA